MSTPMHEVPEHELIPVDATGNGPIDLDDPDFDHWECWCSTGTKVRIKFNGGRGLTMCPRSDVVLVDGFPPGWLERQIVRRGSGSGD